MKVEKLTLFFFYVGGFEMGEGVGRVSRRSISSIMPFFIVSASSS